MQRDQSDYYQRAQPYASQWIDADARPTRTMASARGKLSRSRLRSSVTYLLVSIIIAIMAMGAYAIVRVSLDDMAKHDACAVSQSIIVSEVDEAFTTGQFPSRDQQDRWRQMMQECEK